MTEDLRAHPVVQTILRRREEGSHPGARTDGRRVALLIEGGGLRGVVSAGMVTAIEQLGLRGAFARAGGRPSLCLGPLARQAPGPTGPPGLGAGQSGPLEMMCCVRP